MAKNDRILTKKFRGVPNGAIFPKEFEPGEACPQELQHAAEEQGCFDGKAPARKPKANNANSEPGE